MREKKPKKACPMCHRTLDDRAPRCPCGYEFGQPVERTLEMLRRRKTSAKIVLCLFIVLDVAAVLAIYEVALHGFAVISVFVLSALIAGTARPIRTIGMARDSERLLAPKLLPTARVVRAPGSLPTETAGSGSDR